MKRGALFLLAAICSAFSPVAWAQNSTLNGTWAGKGGSGAGFDIVMTVSANGAETDYPSIGCSGRLTRAGTSGGYTFFFETKERGSIRSGGTCIDGSITVFQIGDRLFWSWFGSHDGKSYGTGAEL